MNIKKHTICAVICPLFVLALLMPEVFAQSQSPELGNDKKLLEKPGENWGSVNGHVVLKGDKPDPLKFPLSDRYKENCKMKGDSLTIQRVQTSPWKGPKGSTHQGIKDVIVFLKKVDQVLKSELPPKQLTIDQKNCRFRPNVGLVQVNGSVLVKNSDPTIHNFNYKSLASLGISGNVTQAQGAKDKTVQVKSPEFVTFRCNMHPWMLGMIRVADHHAYAVTGEKGGFSFQAPAGSYTLVVRHLSSDKKKELPLDVPEGKTVHAKVSLEISGN